MELVSVYKDDNTEVKIMKSVGEMLSTLYADQKTFSEEQFYSFIDFTVIKCQKYTNNKIKKITSHCQVPIIHRKAGFHYELSDTYKPLFDAILLLTDAFNQTDRELTKEWMGKVAALIIYYYQLQGLGNCRIFFFNKKRFDGLTGALTYLKDEELIIFPFILDDCEKYQRLC